MWNYYNANGMCAERGGLHCLDMGSGQGCRKDDGGYLMNC